MPIIIRYRCYLILIDIDLYTLGDEGGVSTIDDCSKYSDFFFY